ncbi:uncharacterized protein HMPREF1541_03180 [Cyphellophora europaea CBS 101466]|uniref:Transcription factor domain-containing protein n=1 Tax=Cyphellophora europaea (strain CBS 101466) TaxID=1220924 RepID=W2RY37_CYPE1|nr:uncharacterized protein HMPREF1541_03180 [Cyphellophora europaea CBS 101466]ETN41245.1 hypothetical protein HMPREF1541_03180 [Cyphellophora europaea CBS 101466]
MSKSNKSFLFVNKDAASLSLTRSSEREQSSINSHVQRGRRHKRQPHASARRKESSKEASPPSLKEAESSGSGASPSASSSSSGSLTVRTSSGFHDFLIPSDGEHVLVDTDQQSKQPYNDNHLRTAQQTSDDLVSIASPTSEADPRGHHIAHGLPTPNGSPTGIMQFSSNPIDPFQRSSIPLDNKSHSLIQYYKEVYHPAVWHVETKASPQGGYAFQTSAADVIRSALTSDVDMYALLACMASRQQYVDRREGYSTDEYLGKALAATRRFIMQRAEQGPKSHEEILMVIFHLYAAEGYRNNTAAAKIHMRGAKTIVAAIGGLSKLQDPQMRELLIIGDGLLSAMTLQPCELPCEFDPGSYSDATPDELRIDAPYEPGNLCPALRLEPRHQIIPPPIQALIDEVAELNWVLIHAKEASPDASTHAMRWIQMRSMAIRHRLLLFEVQDPRLDAFRAVLVLWIVTTTTLLGLKRLALVIAPQIRRKLKAVTEQGLEFNHTDIKAWMLSLGAMSAVPESEDARWFIRKLADLLVSSGAVFQAQTATDEDKVLNELRGLQEKFFYHDAVHSPYLATLAKKVVAEASRRQQWQNARILPR